MRRIFRALAAVPAALLLAALILPAMALAHERRDIGDGKYTAVVGWDAEPALQNEVNAASIRILRAGTEEGVEGLESTLTLRIAFGGGQAREFKLRPAFRDPGYYLADIVPTRAGAYIWTLSGTIEGTQIDETFESGPGRFDDITSTEPLQFPVAQPDPSAAVADAQAARADAASARTLGIAGIVVGALGLLVAAVALFLHRPAAATAGNRPSASGSRG